MRRNWLSILVASVLLMNVVVAPVAAQTLVPDTIFLDRGVELVGEVTLDGQTYEIYRFQNTLWYANGIEVYADDNKVTSRTQAATVIRAYAESQAIDSLDEDLLDSLRTIEANVTAISDETQPVTAEIDASVAFLDALKDEDAGGDQTVWDVAMNESPALEEFNSTTVPELRASVEDWQAAREHLQTNTTALIELLERQEAEGDVDPVILYRQYVGTREALLTFNAQTEQLQSSLSAAVTTSQSVSTEVYGLDDHGEDIALEFVRLGSQLQHLALHIEGVTSPLVAQAGSFADYQRSIRSTERSLMRNWDDRRDAASKVNRTLIAVPLVLVAIGGAFYWRSR